MPTNLTDQQAQARGQRVAGSPQTYTDKIGGPLESFDTKLHEGSPVAGLKEGSEEKMQELFAFDQQLEGQYDPLASQRSQMYPGAVQNPMDVYGPASKAVETGAGNVENIFSTISKLKSLEGQAMNTAISTITNFVKSESARKKDEANREWDKYKFERQMKLEERKLAQGPTLSYTERTDIESKTKMDEMTGKMATGVSLNDMVINYGTDVGVDEVIRLYKLHSPHAKGRVAQGLPPLEESDEQLYNMYGITPSARAPEGDEAISKDERLLESLETSLGIMEELYGRGKAESVGTGKDLSRGPSIWSKLGVAKGKAGRFIGLESDLIEDYKKYEAQRELIVGLITQVLGSGTPQEAEALRLTESAPNLYSTDAEAKEWFKNIKKTIGMGVSMMAPDGKRYTVDRSEVAESIKNGWRKL